ncbi:ABC transporter substrate-binding protein [Actinokineospora sp. HUAS TT18]|uniref:ABC transporter substrate-binding protein n=1 Tax=Actinokineospora sp. HUAS TT18 TaxID=3447451 RepID=UPI003F521A2F
MPERAEKLVADMRADIANATTWLGSVQPLKVFVYDSGDSTAGGTGIGNEIIRLAGGTNVFADVHKDWADVSWEQVLQRAPDVIVVYDYFGTPPVAQKVQSLLDRPELATVPAIRNHRFVTLALQDTVLGIRAPYAVSRLAAQLHPDRMR